jgi:7,8-dihydro-6-hydroxymethylpterin dimethyltransferase
VGEIRRVRRGDLPDKTDDFLILDETGRVLNLPPDSWSCCPPKATREDGAIVCSSPPEISNPVRASQPLDPSPASESLRHGSGCLVCGAPLMYLQKDSPARCHYCQAELSATAVCERGHFVCDDCHTTDGLAAIERFCQTTRETDLITLLDEMRRHPAIPRHGPQHHVMVPAIILTAFRNLGGDVTPQMFRTAFSRGQSISGGSCAFWGVCGAAAGVGIAFSLLLKANPLKPRERRQVLGAVQAVLGELDSWEAARCCQRECWLSLRKAAELSRELLPIPLPAEAPLACQQSGERQDCLQSRCPLWSGARVDKDN